MKKISVIIILLLIVSTAGCVTGSSGKDHDDGETDVVVQDLSGFTPFGDESRIEEEESFIADESDEANLAASEDDSDIESDDEGDDGGDSANTGSSAIDPLEIYTSENLGTAKVEHEFSARIGVNGGDGKYIWSVSNLPEGLSARLTTSRRIHIEGIPVKRGDFEFEATVEEDGNPENRASKRFKLRIVEVLKLKLSRENGAGGWRPVTTPDGLISVSFNAMSAYRIDVSGEGGNVSWTVSDDIFEFKKCYDSEVMMATDPGEFEDCDTEQEPTSSGVISRRFIQVRDDYAFEDASTLSNVIVTATNDLGEEVDLRIDNVDLIGDPCETPLRVTSSLDNDRDNPKMNLRVEGGRPPYTWKTSYYTEMQDFDDEWLRGYTLPTNASWGYNDAFIHFSADFARAFSENGDSVEMTVVGTGIAPYSMKAYNLLLTTSVVDSCVGRKRAVHAKHIISTTNPNGMDTLTNLKIRMSFGTEDHPIDHVSAWSTFQIRFFSEGELVGTVKYEPIKCSNSNNLFKCEEERVVSPLEGVDLSAIQLDKIDKVDLRFRDDPDSTPMDFNIKEILFYTDSWETSYDDDLHGNRFDDDVAGGSTATEKMIYEITEQLDGYPFFWLPKSEN